MTVPGSPSSPVRSMSQWNAPAMGVALTATDAGVNSGDVEIRAGPTAQMDGSIGHRRRSLDKYIHQSAPCCPSCGANLPPPLLSSIAKRTGSLFSGFRSPESSVRGGVRASSLLEFAFGDRGYGPASQSYQSIDFADEAGDLLSDLPGEVSKKSGHHFDGVDSEVDPFTAASAEPGSAASPAPPADPALAAPPAGTSRAGLFLRKWGGIPGKRRPPRSTLAEAAWSFVGALIGIAGLASLDHYIAPGLDTVLIAASFGATAVLLYAAPTVPLAQPINLALTGVLVRMAFGGQMLWLAQGTSVASAIFVMGVTGTMHPPGGAISLIAVIGGKRISDMGLWFVLFPCTGGPLFLLLVAVLVNNLNPARAYPVYWY